MVDLRRPLHCPSNYWDGIFTEHTLEHLTMVDVEGILREILRVLKPGCWLRISVPDLEKYVQYYQKKEGAPEFRRWRTGAEALGSLTQSWGHRSVWDTEALSRRLEEEGFTRIRRVAFGEGTDSLLLKDSEARRWESMYMEAQKPWP
jgi:predicted SAM-dependent methyltransferase